MTAAGRVLVTGASGFIGRHLVQRLLSEGCEVIAWTRRSETLGSDARDRLLIDSVDIRDPEAVSAAVADARVERVFHLAGSRASAGAGWKEASASMRTNVLGTANLLAAFEGTERLERLVFMGSCEEYGTAPVPFDEDAREEPGSPYGVSKLAATRLCAAMGRSGMPVTILRLSVCYGPGQPPSMFIPALIRACLEESASEFEMTKGRQTRDFIYVEDVVEACLLASRKSLAPGQILNVSSEEEVRVAEVAETIVDLTGSELRLARGALPYRPTEPMRYVASNRRAREGLDWAPRIDLTDGLRRTIEAARGRS